MLTRCPACETHFRVTAEQLKARSGKVRCGECQHVFNAIDSLIEEPMVVAATTPAVKDDEITVSPAPTFEPEPDLPPAEAAVSGLGVEAPVGVEPKAVEPEAVEPEAAEPVSAKADDPDWSETFPEPQPPPRRWPWVIGGVFALAALGLQAVLAFRVELAVLMPESKPVLTALCDIADCEVGLPAKVALVSIEASDLHPDSAQKGQLALTATLKNRAPFGQQFPHLELTLTDTADKAIARKILAPADYLPPRTAATRGMPPNADIMVAVGIHTGEMTASGYRLYLFYP